MWLQEPRGGFWSQDLADEAQMKLHEQNGCQSQNGSAGANVQLQDPIYDNKNHDVTAVAMAWVQEQDVDTGFFSDPW